MIELHIDNQRVSAEPNQSLLQAAQNAGITIPSLCQSNCSAEPHLAEHG
ncbi:MAG: 2Fe-2S iron-sulfur cluster-binding protein, partial [Shewanella sp.]